MSEPVGTATAPMRGSLRAGKFELGYVVEGGGRAVLVIGSALYYPRVFSAELRRHLKLVFADHRGFARADGPVTTDDSSFEAVLGDIEAVRSHLGLGRIVIMGHSGHGYMALEYAKRYPQHVSHVVMIATGLSHSAAHAEMTERNWSDAVCPARKAKQARDLALLNDEIAADPARRFITFCLRLGARSWYDHDFDAAPLWRGVSVNMPVFDHLWGEVFRDIDIAKGLEDFDIPVLLALGRFDYLVAPYEAWTPYRPLFRDLTVKVFDRSSHTPQFEESELFDLELLQWLQSRDAAA